MRNYRQIAALAALILIVVYVVGWGVPSASVLWVSGIVGFVAFLIGSTPRNDEKDFELEGAVVWGVAMAALSGGFEYWWQTPHRLISAGSIGIGIGVALVLMRLISTRPPRRPRTYQLQDGVNRAFGDDLQSRLKAAYKLYNKASFSDGARYAARGNGDHRYGAQGIPVEDLRTLGELLSRWVSSSALAILVLLVRELPGECAQPAVIVVKDLQHVGEQIVVDDTGIVVPGFDKKIPANAIAAVVGYAWR
jgi:hypothetical protein